MNEAIQPRRAASPRRKDIGAEALRENRATTGSNIASEPPRDDDEPNLSPRQRQIGQAREIVAVDSLCDHRAARASAFFACGANSDDGDPAILDSIFNVETGWHKSREAKAAGMSSIPQ